MRQILAHVRPNLLHVRPNVPFHAISSTKFYVCLLKQSPVAGSRCPVLLKLSIWLQQLQPLQQQLLITYGSSSYSRSSSYGRSSSYSSDLGSQYRSISSELELSFSSIGSWSSNSSSDGESDSDASTDNTDRSSDTSHVSGGTKTFTVAFRYCVEYVMPWKLQCPEDMQLAPVYIPFFRETRKM